ncbi:nucleotidyltransferase/DNA polymerase involved in DNA repair [Mycolicibacterium phlei]|jgi:DNA polymerase-4|uniref:DNA polymerase IV n=1 Tax=Mycolicibacterium phlei DSM 43239 = CCUG 21000 TaxID=1226750 RepID=A0A5N5V1X2_MYCPH|nr:DNA polymerase IV [Mycolicibacterium phlei]VEG07134.1 nucleotidyltransferase/DNA polymerase involved in DNA repair [Mycobacteroides chelonae]AMO59002.1 DNA polymerase IV [Mycolicibacterium phlei]EID09498.1 DNA polymerase IV [Mycolicibacterium phlei RIVM601174]KAB7754470.1 DNA polymerase IV [Mycolicibacterium phlei DSM 43239 = CCUG 21000]KXW64929.1 DNA polymerase IV [Mycolicibacterium phlei DSM 43070]
MFVSSDPRPSSASILHADLDSFYASVEQRDDPSLRGRPVIVGGGVVLAASYEAKAFGVRTAMSGREARRLCPHAVVVPPRMSAYSQASKAVFEVFHDITPVVEPLSVDEAFLDVSGLWRVSGTPVQIGARLREQVRERVGLPITVGIARTKFLAKVASQEAKPDGLLLVPPDRELAFLHPLPVRRLWGVGAKTAERLHDFGIETVADVAELSESTLCSLVGHAMGSRLFALSRNIDRRRVTTGVRRHSVGAQRALGRRGNTMSHNEIDAVVVNLVDRITRRMRAAGRTGRTVVLRLRFDDYSRATRSHTMPRATASTEPILAAARSLVAAAAPLIAEKGLTLLGFAVSNIDRDGAQQLELPFDDRGDPTAVDAAVDRVRQRYGNAAVTRGVLVGRDPGLEVPHLPD